MRSCGGRTQSNRADCSWIDAEVKKKRITARSVCQEFLGDRIGQPQKTGKSRSLDFSAAAPLFSATTEVRDPILDETIWSLTSQRVRRISGSRNFRPPPQKDFCNNIRP